jgi:uncharacterized membrane protein
MYDVALFLHLVGVVLLVGAVTTTMVATLRVQRAASVAEVVTLTAVTKKVDVVIGPGLLLILGSALYMLSKHGGDGGIPWTAGWVVVAFGIFLVMAILGPTVEAGHAKRVLRLAAELPDGPVPPALDDARRAPVGTYVAFFGAAQIIATLFLMTVKPDLLGSLAVFALAGLLSIAVSTARLRSLDSAGVRETAAGRQAAGA